MSGMDTWKVRILVLAANERRLQNGNWGGFAGASLFPPPLMRCPLAGWEWVCCEGFSIPGGDSGVPFPMLSGVDQVTCGEPKTH